LLPRQPTVEHPSPVRCGRPHLGVVQLK